MIGRCEEKQKGTKKAARSEDRLYDGLALQVRAWEAKGDNLAWGDLPELRRDRSIALIVLGLREMEYADYLQTHHWKVVRQEALDRARGLCICGEPAFDVHHMHYRTRGFEGPGDVVALCRDCHESWHLTWIHKSRAALESET